MEKEILLKSTITCPMCGYKESEVMPTDSCQWYYECKECSALLKPKNNDCCVFCSYAKIPCPPTQKSNNNVII